MRTNKPMTVRRARSADAGYIRALQAAAFRIGTRSDYDPGEVESLLTYAGTLEPGLIEDGTYFVAEIEGEIVASGGWSARTAEYQSFVRSGMPAPAGSGIIRGVYVDPAYASTGLARRIVDMIEDDIAASGYNGAYIATTYTGMAFFTSAGFKPCNLLSLAFPDGHELHGVAMLKPLSPSVALAA